MKKLSVSDLAKLYGISRQAIYAHINKGNLSKGSDGLIDFSEALRAFGEPKKQEKNVKLSQSIDSNILTEVDTLKRQVDMLEKQLNQAISRESQSFEREIFYQAQIEAMQRLLEAPKPSSNEDTQKSNTNEINTSSSEVDIRKEEGSENIGSIQIDNSKAESVGFWRKIFRPKN
ncbi:plasmid replication DNA-binding protein [Acinetobacter pollinis]|uniref:DNA-binding protein n=1 Tax=Acinetobacter pollinis TaxID=2605270 RepID=A0ABU6DVQ2_9GAMM|nr:plasmid replication DNA-binding protein [Acinetobacter pollinis]MEB5477929.1 DNA-binding protein [Acinetobacter pollinis]